MSACKAYQGMTDDTLYLRFEGDLHCGRDWSFGLSKALSAHIDRVFRNPDFGTCVIDLREVTSIDSTNLGLLARIASEMMRMELDQPLLVCPPSDVLTTIEGVGFDTIFTITDNHPSGGTATDPIEPETGDEGSLRAVLLDSHRQLVGLNEANAARFGHIVDAIALDIPG
jgi:anti-anti-sigma factor